jgi:hypothetical protein
MNSARFAFLAALIFSTPPLSAQQKQLPKYPNSEAKLLRPSFSSSNHASRVALTL